MTYSVRVKKRAVKGLSSLPANVRRDLAARIEALGADPLPHSAEPLRGEFAGLHRLRVGDDRIVYQIDETRRAVVVLRVGHRHNVYK